MNFGREKDSKLVFGFVGFVGDPTGQQNPMIRWRYLFKGDIIEPFNELHPDAKADLKKNFPTLLASAIIR